MVTGNVPCCARWSTAKLSLEVPLPATEVGLNLGITVEGKPLTLRLTTPVNPFKPVIVTVTSAFEFRLMVIGFGAAEIVKSAAGTGSTLRFTVNV